MTKEESDKEVLAYFERKNRERNQARMDEMLRRALAGDLWVAGQIHLASLDGDLYACEAVRSSSELREILAAPRV